MNPATYTKSGTKAATTVKLDKKVFGVEVTNHELLKEAYVAYLANGRVNLAKTKKRGEVRGGGRKPWKQKGTGRARFGSIRTPIWRGGGITFGPEGNENYTKKLPVNAKRTALRQALSQAADEKRIKVIESFNFKDGKVKPTVALLAKIEATGYVLLVAEQLDELAKRATGNLPKVKVVSATYLNVFDLMNADSIIIETKALDAIGQWLGASK